MGFFRIKMQHKNTQHTKYRVDKVNSHSTIIQSIEVKTDTICSSRFKPLRHNNTFITSLLGAIL